MHDFWENMSFAFLIIGTIALLIFGVGGCIERGGIRKIQHVENMAKMGFTLMNPEHAPEYWRFVPIDSCGDK